MSSLGARRRVEPEILDTLPPEDRAARRSRNDLYRVNRLMGSAAILRAGLRPAAAQRRLGAPLRLLELGAGDGRLMLRVARLLARPPAAHSQPWRTVELRLLDRQALVSAASFEAYAQLGWRAQPLICDVRDWVAAASSATHYDVIVVNLFLHHFETPVLRVLLAAAAGRCERFVACEPRRSTLALLGSRLLGGIGANRVTRHDAVASVRAGFRDHELSALWAAPGWQLHERAAGPFAHLFSAWRQGGSEPAAQ